MKNLYKITDQTDNTLCFQVAPNPTLAIEFAIMYGRYKAAKAALILENV